MKLGLSDAEDTLDTTPSVILGVSNDEHNLGHGTKSDALSCGCIVEVLRYEVMYLRFV